MLDGGLGWQLPCIGRLTAVLCTPSWYCITFFRVLSGGELISWAEVPGFGELWGSNDLVGRLPCPTGPRELWSQTLDTSQPQGPLDWRGFLILSFPCPNDTPVVGGPWDWGNLSQIPRPQCAGTLKSQVCSWVPTGSNMVLGLRPTISWLLISVETSLKSLTGSICGPGAETKRCWAQDHTQCVLGCGHLVFACN